MKSIAVTNACRLTGNYLKRWIAYYGENFDQLGVVYQEADDNKLDEMKKKGLILKHIEDYLGDIAPVNEYLNGLLSTYDVICCPGMDEFLVPDPNKYKNLREYVEKMGDRATAKGYNVRQVEGEPPLQIDNWPLLAQRRYWTYAYPYNKTLIYKIPTDLVDGFHYTTDMWKEYFPLTTTGTKLQEIIDKYVDEDLRLIHFKLADRAIYDEEMKHGGANVVFTDGIDKIELIPERFKVI